MLGRPQGAAPREPHRVAHAAHADARARRHADGRRPGGRRRSVLLRDQRARRRPVLGRGPPRSARARRGHHRRRGARGGRRTDLFTVVELAAGAPRLCARTATPSPAGAPTRWGSSAAARAGSLARWPRPVRFDQAVTSTTVIAAGGAHACAIVSGAVWCWGAGSAGQLGNGRFGHVNTPVRVSASMGDAPTALCAGLEHLRRVWDGVWCWGANALGHARRRHGDDPQRHARRRRRPPVAPGEPRLRVDLHLRPPANDSSVHCWGGNNIAGARGDVARRHDVPGDPGAGAGPERDLARGGALIDVRGARGRDGRLLGRGLRGAARQPGRRLLSRNAPAGGRRHGGRGRDRRRAPPLRVERRGDARAGDQRQQPAR